MKKILLSIMIFGMVLSGCQKEKQRFSGICYDCGFNTVWNWILYTEDEEIYDEYVSEIYTYANKYHRLFDIYNNYDGVNNIKTINDNAGIAPVKVESEIIELIEMAKEMYELSDGLFDITQGSLLRVWHNYREEGKVLNANGEYGNLPSEEELLEASQYHGFEHVIIDSENSTVYIDDPNVSLDAGGIAKGFAVEKIAEKLQEDGITNGSVVGGGNVRTINNKGDGTPWGVGINDPRSTDAYSYEGITNVYLTENNSVVTSADNFNYYLFEGDEKMHHIINPKTLYPSDYYMSVSIITPHSGLADALSTSLFNMTIEEGLAFIEKVSDYYDTSIDVLWVLKDDNTEDVEVEIINDLRIYMTEGFREYTTK